MQTTLRRRMVLGGLAAIAGCAMSAGLAHGQQPTSIKVGWAISKTGPYSAGANITLLGAYKTWIKDVNDAGGINVGGKKLPIEVVEYDDRSNSEELVKALERLTTQDKVDFVLPPWGTAFNLAAGPILNRAGYPHLAITATTDRAPELAKRWTNSFWFLGTSSESGPLGGRVAHQAAHRGQDRQQRRDDQRRRPVRHRPVDRRARRLQEGELHPRLRQVLSARHAGHAAAPDRSDAHQCADLRGVQLSARHAADQRSGARPELQSESLLHRGRHRLPAVQGPLQGATPRACWAPAACTPTRPPSRTT